MEWLFTTQGLGLVIEWAAMHQNELKNNWESARKQETLIAIEPLV